jgi:enoyl-[acyl-carrier-protein] reductase (NADH)
MNLDDKNFLKEVEEYTGSLLLKKDDIHKLIEVVITEKKEEEFEKLTFTAKYICGMMRVVKNSAGIPEVSSIEHIKNDLNENIKKGIEQLKEIISSSSGSEKDYFDKTYFTLTTENFSNLTQIFSDLESVKKYINHLKRLT